jgi:hypothetical protein
MNFDRDVLGRVAGYPLVDLLGVAALGYVASNRLNTPVVPTIVATFAVGEGVYWAMGVNTPFQERVTGTTFFPAPATGRHLNQRACNCN